jgi:hypothetical protein
MKIIWQIDPADAVQVKDFLGQHRDNAFVRKRIETNLRAEKPPVTRETFWYTMVGCLLTTQQRSGPNSPISRFLTEPFPLRYEVCAGHPDLASFARNALTEFRGIRRANTIGREAAANLAYLETGGWEPTFAFLEEVRLNPTPQTERKAAGFLDGKLWGFGPKQSRNLLQWLGLSRYEIPIDSRVTKWLNRFGFPIRLNAFCLADGVYYNFVSDGFQRLCEACDIVPCVLDAAIFASFDGDRWTDENV